LLALGAEVRIADPHVSQDHVHGRVERVEVTPEELSAADAVIVLTDHDAFDLDAVRAHAGYVLDTRRRVAPGDHIEYL
jgi:UDP-N-acetyl-D-glucosamine dehydrogenase